MDALVLAGAGPEQVFRLAGRPVPKPFVELGGEPLVRRAVRAALEARGVGRVFVLGELARLEVALRPWPEEQAGRLRLVPQAGDLLASCRRVFFERLLPELGLDEGSARRATEPAARRTALLVLASDLPFVAARDVEAFLAAAPDDGGVVVGLCDHAALEDLRELLAPEAALDRWKLGGIPLWPWSVRLSNLWLVRPLMFDPTLYALVEQVYTHRWLLARDGRILWRNWWAIVRAFWRQGWRAPGRGRFLRGVVNFVPAVLAMAVARAVGRGPAWLARPFRRLLGQRDVEAIGTWLLGAPARMVVTREPAPAVDLDVEEGFLRLQADGEAVYRRLAERLGR